MAPAPKEVVITGINIPFFTMVWLIVKWGIAAIPALIVLWILGFLFTLTVGSSLAALIAALQAAAA